MFNSGNHINFQTSLTHTTSLMWYIQHDLTNDALELLEHPEIDISLTDYYGCNALLMAIEKDNREIIEKLLSDFSHDFNHTTIFGDTALSLALCKRNNELAKFLLSQPNIFLGKEHRQCSSPDELCSSGNTKDHRPSILHLAVRINSIEIIRFMVENL